MKQDLDLQRELLIEIESCESLHGLGFAEKRFWEAMGVDATTEASSRLRDLTKEASYNLDLLGQRELVIHENHGGHLYFNLTALGHDYLDAIRADNVWNRTKKGALSVGGMTLGMMKDLAMAYVKQEASEKLGVSL